MHRHSLLTSSLSAVCSRSFHLRHHSLLFLSALASAPSSSTYHPAFNNPIRASQVSSFKQEGYYRLDSVKAIDVDECVYDVKMVRGSGPGGQGTNSSSNKAEIRVDMELLGEFFDEEIIQAIKRNESGKSLTASGDTLILTCHEHRSGYQNREGCLHRLKEIIFKASWVPPVEADAIVKPGYIVTQRKQERRIKSNMNRAKRSARKGLW